MINTASFQTRARTIDHLGRGQIADAPTAVSELWKNAYDAYARNVELHIFDGKVLVAGVMDNGHGMTAQELLNNWLVIGTESKVRKDGKPEDRFGLPQRATQGEKGIGRLSAAYLAPMTLVVTKREGSSFAAILVDWRFFENPFLLISDVEFPIAEFGEIKELPEQLPAMFLALRKNLGWEGMDDAKAKRLSAAWDSFDELERQQDKKVERTTREAILSFDDASLLQWEHVFPWWDMMKKASEYDIHGTAMFAIDINDELGKWVRDEYEGEDGDKVKQALVETLVNFTDPYEDRNLFFDYCVAIHRQNKPEHIAVSSAECFSLEELHALEHYVDGQFDELGVFTGAIKAFGKDRGHIEIRPAKLLKSQGKGRLGPFKFCIGTIEQELKSTTHSEEEYTSIKSQAEKYSGICMYRDALRVMPYGREGEDLFNIEERRSKHAGREFFSYRRSFGRVSFSSQENPYLKDKAGREGLVVNKARREMVDLVVNVLRQTARQFFGYESELRYTELPGIRKRNAAMQKAAETARKRNQKNFSRALRLALPKVTAGLNAIRASLALFEEAQKNRDAGILAEIQEKLNEFSEIKDTLRLPNRPAVLGQNESDYRAFRDAYGEFCSALEALKKNLAKCEAEGLLGDPKRIVLSRFHSNESRLSSQIGGYLKTIKDNLDLLRIRWDANASEDRKLYNKNAALAVNRLEQGEGLAPVLNLLDAKQAELRDDFEIKYSAIINSLSQVAEDVDIEGAFFWTDRENAKLEEKVQLLHSVAQLGISVEIIGHELEALESQVSTYLRRMPNEVRALTSYKNALEAFSQLTDRLRFLTPLKKTAYRNRIRITGKDIGDYLRDFFGDTFEKYRIDFIVTPAFERLAIRDLPSRIYPTFINLVNNSLYWVQYGERRTVQLDVIDGKAIISDTGKGIDRDDLDNLFQLFFTRRTNGRGIGLYLCRQNLAVANHTIRYANDSDPHPLEGANFIIEFKDAENA